MSDRNLSLDFTPRAPSPEPEVPSASPPSPKPEDEGPRALSVAELDRAIRRSLEHAFEDAVWVEGEVTGARPASSGHLYFCLKDEREEASIDVAMYKTSITPRARKLLVDGARVRLRGRPTFWAPRGRLQFIADRVEAVGKGALLEALERLKEKLRAEGLFALERKRPLPASPRIIGVVTSAGGAVIHDITKVAFRRGGARILLAAALVQGQGAAESIRRALAMLQRVAEVDVIILGRGGGSSDDLGAFNDEALVRAVASCRVPIVSAVGHEVDVTLTDFAADARAATPSQAAELTVVDRRAQASLLHQTQLRLVRAMRGRITGGRVHLQAAQKELSDPRLAIASKQQVLDDRVSRLEASARHGLGARRTQVARLNHALVAQHPSTVIGRERAAVARCADRMGAVMRARVARRFATLESIGARLDAMSPLKVLGRGYAIATRPDGRAVREASDVSAGERVVVRVLHARIEADVVSVVPEEEET